MELYVGTSGWLYSWNKGSTLDWYVANSGLNAIELNASFYRFPYPNQVKHWSKVGSSLSWSIKVNRLITHRYKLSKSSYNSLEKFLELFKPLEDKISYYLFQLPPSIKPSILSNVENMLDEFDIKEKFAIELRSNDWLKDEVFEEISKLGITFVSVDAPFASIIRKTSSSIYLRMHGRKEWYSYNYSKKELEDIMKGIKAQNPKKAYIFFNNDHDMLENARSMLKLAKEG
jgi:uncharacterized protein YecE (DUF72 family)